MFKRLLVFVFAFITVFAFFGSANLLAESNGGNGTVDEWFEDDSKADVKQPAIGETDSGVQEEGMTFPIIKMVLALAFILFLIYGLAKFVNKRTRVFSGNRSIATIGGVSVGSNRSVQVVKVGDRILVVGVGDTVQLLKEISDEAEIEKLFQEDVKDHGYDDALHKVKAWFGKRRSTNKPLFPSILDQELRQMSEKRKALYNTIGKKESKHE